MLPSSENDHRILHTRIPPTPAPKNQTSPNRSQPPITPTPQPPVPRPRLVAPASRNQESPPGLPSRPRLSSSSPPRPPTRGTRMNPTREMTPLLDICHALDPV